MKLTVLFDRTGGVYGSRGSNEEGGLHSETGLDRAKPGHKNLTSHIQEAETIY